MSLFAIGDPHLSFGCQKPMDIFKGWENHAVRLEKNWKDTVEKEDTVVLPGDISWAIMTIGGQPGIKWISFYCETD